MFVKIWNVMRNRKIIVIFLGILFDVPEDFPNLPTSNKEKLFFMLACIIIIILKDRKVLSEPE